MQSPSIFMSRMTWNRFILAPGTSVLSDFELPNPQKADSSPTANFPTLKGVLFSAVVRRGARGLNFDFVYRVVTVV